MYSFLWPGNRNEMCFFQFCQFSCLSALWLYVLSILRIFFGFVKSPVYYRFTHCQCYFAFLCTTHLILFQRLSYFIIYFYSLYNDYYCVAKQIEHMVDVFESIIPVQIIYISWKFSLLFVFICLPCRDIRDSQNNNLYYTLDAVNVWNSIVEERQ